MPKNKWEGQVKVSLDDIFGEPNKDDIIEDDIEENEDDTDKEITNQEDIDILMAEYGMEVIDGFEDEYQGKKMIFKEKPTLSYFEFYLDHANTEYLGNILIDKFPKSFKKLFDKKMESISNDVEEQSSIVSSKKDDDNIVSKEMFEKTLTALKTKTHFAQQLIEMLSWIYGWLGDEEVWELKRDFIEKEIEMLKEIKKVIT